MNGSIHRALLSLSIAIAMSVVCVGSSAQTVKLYKVIDKDGRVTYLDHPPEPGAGYVEEKDIDVGTNVLDPAAIPAPPESSTEDDTTPASEEGGEAPTVGAGAGAAAAGAEEAAQAAAAADAAAAAEAAASGVAPSSPPLTTIGP
jgi:hypothetical protein